MSSQAEIEESQRLARELYELHARTFATLDGAASLIAAYGSVPSFHDGEVTDLSLRRIGESKLRVWVPYPDVFGLGGTFVTFAIARILDLELEGSSPQNVLFSLNVTPSPRNAEREMHYGFSYDAADVKIELDPTWGVGGYLICSGVKVAWTKDRTARKPSPRGPART